MTGVEEIGPLIASLFAATAPEAGAAAGSAAAAGATAAGAGAATAAAAGQSAALLAAGSGGLTALETASLAGTALSAAGTGAQLLAGKPKIPNVSPVQRDEARLEADQRNALLKRKGRASALLTPGGAQGTAGTSPTLGAAALLGSG